MPDNVTLGVGSQVEAADHHATLLEVFSNGECKKVLINLSLQVKLLDEERCTLTSRHRCQANNTVAGHAREALLIGCRNKSHVIHALVVIGAEADLILGAVAPNVTTAIAHLTEVCAQLPEAPRL